MQNNKIRYIPIGQAERLADWVEEQKAKSKKIERRINYIGILSFFLVIILFIISFFVNIPQQDDPYQPAEGVFSI